ncbi:MAG: CPBP family intramembrane metalloprotease [Bacteroidetes bacterium]|nr:CPBP family intramembrane metalloprotease [Bacteroidota bacterium]MCL5025005.1 CPBP family intramembrane metalloprotease [Chloroflexota bacterium]
MSALGLFWNRVEGRPRAFWRLLAQSVMFLVAIVVFGVLSSAFALAFLTRTGGTPLSIADPAALREVAGKSPLFMALNIVGSLLAAVVSVGVAVRLLDRRPFADLGFHFDRDWWLDLAFGLGLGALLMVMIFLVEWALGWVSVTSTLEPGPSGLPFGLAVLGGLVGFVGVGIYEELFSRGYQLRNLAEGLNFDGIGPAGALVLAWLISSAVFGLLHAGNPNATLVSILNLLVAGLFLGLGFVLTGELAISIGLHITWNFFQGYVFGFPVSGLARSASFIAIAQGGPEGWTGGAFGPEAGIVGLAATVVGGLLTVAWVRRHYGCVGLYTSLARYSRGAPQKGPSGLD